MPENLSAMTTPDGVTLRYTDEGSGEPALVFVHGWTCDHANWRNQVPYFAERHRVVALDQRGHGESDKPDQDYRIAGFVDDLAWLIGKLSLDRPVIIGHSMGGGIALGLARKHPELVRAIVMIDSPVVPLPATLKPMVDGMIAGLRSDAYLGVAEGFARMQFFNDATPPRLVDELIPSMMKAPQRLMHTALADLLATAETASGPIPVPALLIRAETAFAEEDAFRECFPGLEVSTLGCAHFVQMEKPEETNALIRGFLEAIG
jgi:pimeloyl-ACP methyl ester carboxylesterase